MRADYPYYSVGVKAKGDGQFHETYWTSPSYPDNKEDLWVALKAYDLALTLGTKLQDIVKLDMWSNNELTAFAVTIDNNPAIAVYSNYPVQLYHLVADVD